VKRGFTIIELLVAAIVVVIAIGLALAVFRNQNSNMINIRQHVQAQTSARDGLKILESELRIAGFSPAMGFGSRGDSITSCTSTCVAMQDANKNSVVASDGAVTPIQNDTLYVAFPTVVVPRTGVDCANSILWSRYHLNTAGNLMRTTADTKSHLATSSDSTVVAQNVDVFQVRLGLMGLATPVATALTATQACCAVTANWTKTNANTIIAAGALTITPTTVNGSWSVLNGTTVTTSKGERLRDTFSIQPDANFFTDLAAGATVSAGIYDASTGNPVAVQPILTKPAAAKSLCALNGWLTFAIDLVDPTGGTRKIGFSGATKATLGSLKVDTLNALRVGAGADGSSWFKNPSDMLASDWSRIKAVEVKLLAKAKSSDGTKSAVYNDLANYNVSGTFTPPANDANLRVLFDHVYPVGNNGGF